MQSDKWRAMGREAANAGKPDTACPYTVMGTAWRFWMEGYKEKIAADDKK